MDGKGKPSMSAEGDDGYSPRTGGGKLIIPCFYPFPPLYFLLLNIDMISLLLWGGDTI